MIQKEDDSNSTLMETMSISYLALQLPTLSAQGFPQGFTTDTEKSCFFHTQKQAHCDALTIILQKIEGSSRALINQSPHCTYSNELPNEQRRREAPSKSLRRNPRASISKHPEQPRCSLDDSPTPPK